MPSNENDLRAFMINRLKFALVFLPIAVGYQFIGCNGSVSNGDTLIILDPFSCKCVTTNGITLHPDIEKMLESEFDAMFMENQLTEDKLIINFGNLREDDLIVALPDSMQEIFRGSEYQPVYKKFKKNVIKKITKTITDNSNYDSNYFGVFGYRYLRLSDPQNGTNNNNLKRVILAGNLVEKAFHNMALERRNFDRIDDDTKKDSVRAEFDSLKSKFETKFGKYKFRKVEIELYILKQKLESLIYSDDIIWDSYDKLIAAFFIEYDLDKNVFSKTFEKNCSQNIGSSSPN